MKQIMVKCPCCDGSGKSPLSESLKRTLDAVPRDVFMSTPDITAKLDEQYVKPTAINNRLRLGLLPFGLVKFERRGKSLFWKRIK